MNSSTFSVNPAIGEPIETFTFSTTQQTEAPRACGRARMNKPLKTIAGAAFVVCIGVTSPTPIAAQNTVWRIDSEHSTARLFLASSRIPDARVNVGVARIGGLVDRNDGDTKDSNFDFTIYPADGTVAPTLSNDKSSYQDLPITAASTVITFKSQQVVPTGGGAVRVSGELTVTYIERSATFDPTEAYDGPVYGPPLMHFEKQKAVFEFERIGASAMRARQQGGGELPGSSVIGAEDFPELFTAVSATDWPAFVEDEHCTWPLTVGEDFSGPACTGKTIEPLPRTDIHCEMPSTVGEDFAGEVCTGTPLQMAPSDVVNNWERQARGAGTQDKLIANEVIIQLDLKLTQSESLLSERVGQSESQ